MKKYFKFYETAKKFIDNRNNPTSAVLYDTTRSVKLVNEI
jgi:hypothetical protein